MDEARYQVFISYNRDHSEAVERIVALLQGEGITTWFDRNDLIPGEPWQERLLEGLHRSDTCATFFGPSGMAGDWQREEIHAAIQKRVKSKGSAFRVIPVVLPGAKWQNEDGTLDFLDRATRVEFSSFDDKDALRQLIAGILGKKKVFRKGAEPFPDQCPYPGLRPFEIGQAGLFSDAKS